MTIKTTTFEIFSNGKSDIIDITPKIIDAAKNLQDVIAIATTNEKNCAIVQFKESEIKNFIEYFNNSIDNSLKYDINHLEDCVNFKNALKSLILGKDKIINLESIINKDEKILFLDFSQNSAKKQIVIKIIN